MATLTAQILVGTGHPNHDGINPTHYIFLSENSRPSLILVEENIFNEKNSTSKIIWIPTVENTFGDALLMINFHVLKSDKLASFLEKQEIDLNEDFGNLYEIYKKLSQEKNITLKELDDLNIKIFKEYEDAKLVVSILKESTLYRQIDTIKKSGINCVVLK